MRGNLCASQGSRAVAGALRTVRNALPNVGLGSWRLSTSRKHRRVFGAAAPVLIVKIRRFARGRGSGRRSVITPDRSD
jgi:hypothetical protein